MSSRKQAKRGGKMGGKLSSKSSSKSSGERNWHPGGRAAAAVWKGISLYVFAVSLLAVPLYMDKAYFNLIEAKAAAYRVLVLPAFAAAALLLLAVAVFRGKGTPGRNSKETVSRRLHAGGSSGEGRQAGALSAVRFWFSGSRFCTSLLTGVALWSLAATLLSADPKASFLGFGGWCVGSLLTVLLIFGTILTARVLPYSQNLMIPVMLVNGFILGLMLVQAANVDAFGLWKNLDMTIYEFHYLSTIGQKNSFAGYLCLLVPLFCGFFIVCTERVSAVLYGVFCAAGFLCVFLCDSDCVYAGLGLCALAILPMVLASRKNVTRGGILLLLAGACLLLAEILPVFARKAAKLQGISAKVVSLPCGVALCAAGAVLLLLARRMAEIPDNPHMPGNEEKTETPGSPERSRMLQNWGLGRLLVLLEGILLCGILAAVIYTAFHFDDAWGSHRGAIWRTGWEYFFHASPFRRLVGAGPEMMEGVFLPLRQTWTMRVVSAHSEPLQVLLSQGLIGLGLYLAFWGHLTATYIRKKQWLDGSGVFFLPLAAYFGQSLFCSTYPVTAAVFSVMAGLYLKAAA